MNSNLKIAAGVVLYNPDDITRFENCLKELNKQFDKIYIYNNGKEYSFEKWLDVITYMSEGENKGIAYALNRIMEHAKADGYQWVVTMDQDSIIPEGMLLGFKQSINSHNDIGIVCPQVIDRRRIYSKAVSDDKEMYVDFCITSASCTAIEAWEKCGKFDEWLFIDLVDNDFCKRLTLSGYNILKLNKWILDQEFGKIIPKDRKTQEFWYKVSKILHNQNFAKFSYKKEINPLRVYYTNRNIIYVNKKMRQYGTVGFENYNCKGYVGFIFCFMIPSVLRAHNKLATIKATITGIKDGIESKPIEWEVKRYPNG